MQVVRIVVIGLYMINAAEGCTSSSFTSLYCYDFNAVRPSVRGNTVDNGSTFVENDVLRVS